jgi:hypothetical protein
LREQGLQRHPERHLGPARVRGLSAYEKAQFAEFRGPDMRPHGN